MPSPFAQLARLLFGRRWRKGLICVLAAYFDESEQQNPRGVYVVAACVSTAGRWESFARDWQKELGPGVVFHATEWAEGAHGIGRFAGLTARERRTRERKLRRLIAQHTIRCFVDGTPGRDVMAQQARLMPIQSDPHIHALFGCLSMIHHAKGEGRVPADVVDCFFERRNKREDKRLDRQYERITEQWFPGEFGPAVVGRKDDPQMVPLQAADFLAYYAMREIVERYDGKPPSKPFASAMARDGKLFGAYQTHAQYLRAIEAVKEHHKKVERGEIILPPYPKRKKRAP